MLPSGKTGDFFLGGKPRAMINITSNFTHFVMLLFSNSEVVATLRELPAGSKLYKWRLIVVRMKKNSSMIETYGDFEPKMHRNPMGTCHLGKLYYFTNLDKFLKWPGISLPKSYLLGEIGRVRSL